MWPIRLIMLLTVEQWSSRIIPLSQSRKSFHTKIINICNENSHPDTDLGKSVPLNLIYFTTYANRSRWHRCTRSRDLCVEANRSTRSKSTYHTVWPRDNLTRVFYRHYYTIYYWTICIYLYLLYGNVILNYTWTTIWWWDDKSCFLSFILLKPSYTCRDCTSGVSTEVALINCEMAMGVVLLRMSLSGQTHFYSTLVHIVL